MNAFVSAVYDPLEAREARIDRLAVWKKLTAQEREVLLASEREQASHFDDFLLSLFTTNRPDNDLTSKNSIWRLALVVPGEGELLPETVEEVRIDSTVRALYPNVGDFDVVYRVRFPRWKEPLAGRSFTLRLAGSRGLLDFSTTGRSRRPGLVPRRRVLVEVPSRQHRVVELPLIRRGEIEQVVQPARLLPPPRALDDEHRHVGQVAQLDQIRRHLVLPVIVTDLAPQQVQPGPGALEALRRSGRSPRSSTSGGAPPPSCASPPRPRPGRAPRRDSSPATAGVVPGTPCRSSLACSAARRPKTSPSSSEFEARRFAPCKPVQETSPMARSCGTEVAPMKSVTTPPH